MILKCMMTVFEKERIIGERKRYLMVEKLNGVDFIEELQSHENRSIYNLASEIIKEYGQGEQIVDNA